MKISTFEKVIRKVVREEIDYALRREIALLKEELNDSKSLSQIKESKSSMSATAKEEFRQKLKSQFTPQPFSSDNTLNNLLNETAQNSFNEPVHNPHDPVNQFLNKDYGPLMAAMDKKKEHFRP